MLCVRRAACALDKTLHLSDIELRDYFDARLIFGKRPLIPSYRGNSGETSTPAVVSQEGHKISYGCRQEGLIDG